MNAPRIIATIDPPASPGPVYLATPIAEAKRVYPRQGSGMTQAGYTLRSGAPTSLMIRLQGEKIWRRVMCWCFSNSGTLFVRIQGTCMIVREYMIPEVPGEQAIRMARQIQDMRTARGER